MVFEQNYLPAGNFSWLIALIPVILILLLMSKSRILMWKITLFGAVLTFILAAGIWKLPIGMTVSAALLGALNAAFPIIWTLGSAMWLFQLLTVTGIMDDWKAFLQTITGDRRLQALLIGTAFTLFLESVAAFGAPIAIVTAMLIGIGFPAETAVTVALLSDMIPSPYGTQSMPLAAIEQVTGISAASVGQAAILLLLPLSVLVCCLIVTAVSGIKGLREMLPAVFLLGIGYCTVNYVTACAVSIQAAGLAAGMAMILLMFLLAYVCKKKKIREWHFPEDRTDPSREISSSRRALRAAFPYVLLVGLTFFVNLEPIRSWLSVGSIRISWPGLHVSKSIGGVLTAYTAEYSCNCLTNGGSLVFFSCILSIPVLKIRKKDAAEAGKRMFRQLFFPGITLLCVLSMAYVMNYSGMTLTIGIALLTLTESFFGGVSVLIGTVGCILTGSVAGSNALFSALISEVGRNLGQAPEGLLGALCCGGALGKIAAPQNLTIAGGQLETGQRKKIMPGITRKMLRTLALLLMLQVLWTILAMLFIKLHF